MRHVVIGGAGFIGANLAARLLDDGEDVVVLDNFSRLGADANVEWLKERYPGVSVVKADIRRDIKSLERAISRADAVYHLAAQVAVTTSVADPRTDFEINALGSFNVLEAARRTRSEAVFVYASTNKVYGSLEDVPVQEDEIQYVYADGRRGIREEERLDFHSPYGCSKGAGDQYFRDYARIFGLRTIVLRQSCIYGPRQFGVEDQGWLAWFCIAAATGRPITLYGTGKQVRDLLHVGDLIDVMRLVVRKDDIAGGQIYNVGGGPTQAVSLLEALALLADELGHPIDYAFGPARPGDQPIYVSDITKARDQLGWEPQIGLEDGIRQLADWVTSNRELFNPRHARSHP